MPYIICAAACLWLDLFYFTQLHTLLPDEHRFLAEAAGEFHGAWEMPGTALFYMSFVFVFGKLAPFFIRLTQAALCVYQVKLIHDLALTIYGKDAAKVAAWISAVYPFFLFYQGLLLSECMFTVLLVWAVLLFYRNKSNIWLFSLLTYIKPTLLMFPVFAAPNLKSIIIRLSVFALIMSPWVLRNQIVLGSPVLFTTGSADNLYIGNNPKSTGGIDYYKDADINIINQFNSLPELQRQKAYSDAAWNYIRNNPIAFAHRAWIKFLRFWNVIPNASEYGGIYKWISGLTFGPILLLALWSTIKHRNWKTMLPIYCLIGYMTALHCIVIASLRYRFPIEPFLIIMASGVFSNGLLTDRDTNRADNRCTDMVL